MAVKFVQFNLKLYANYKYQIIREIREVFFKFWAVKSVRNSSKIREKFVKKSP